MNMIQVPNGKAIKIIRAQAEGKKAKKRKAFALSAQHRKCLGSGITDGSAAPRWRKKISDTVCG